MADINDVNSANGAGEGSARGFDRVKAILAELADATRTTAESIADEQKHRAAERVAGAAKAVRCAAQCFDQSESPVMARCTHRAADRIEDFSRAISGRRWSEMVAAAEDFARRQPTLFVLGAAAAGFLAGRLLLAAGGGQSDPSASPDATVTAAVASGSGEFTSCDAKGSETPEKRE